MQNLFTYGSLQHPEIQQKLFNKILIGHPDTLLGYEKRKLDVEGKGFNIALPNPEERIVGTIYQLTKEEIERADRYEGKAYSRIKVKLLSGIYAWLYMRK